MSDTPSNDQASDSDRAASSAAYSPLYQQIKGLLLQSLDRGEWKPGESIPSELELAARFQVSQGTVRKAIDELAAENLLLRRQGKGTFVATHQEAKVRFRFLRLTPDDGQPKVTGSQILDCRRVKAPVDIARLLDLRTADAVINLRRLLSFEQVPTILDDIWLPGSVFRGLTVDSVSRYRGPLYALFESEFGISMVRADEKIKAVSAGVDQAELLQVAPSSPLLQVERVSYTYGDRPVEVRRGLYVTERFHYRNSLN
ncbi:GntR family transcriptional regulator [Eoetvoesiella caeni]|uniref:GntR family transcriptional regulator n=1 Tax=Eoetvoesiella caeni TaxID=645616 RepID=A0A366H625_9BURK|nr:GntR family transcriptional regulator [Eoetvoesiella caeni]MCI2809973.1 GntR family transcriptional regulator [Eoetvoesiella caeni]NYT55849.1 GntR family transcriptional regulator [Eoetvoesiella caeni]RBP37540.1 GntR family transcriptional regulator [Eoetvoesiella caeni]